MDSQLHSAVQIPNGVAESDPCSVQLGSRYQNITIDCQDAIFIPFSLPSSNANAVSIPLNGVCESSGQMQEQTGGFCTLSAVTTSCGQQWESRSIQNTSNGLNKVAKQFRPILPRPDSIATAVRLSSIPIVVTKSDLPPMSVVNVEANCDLTKFCGNIFEQSNNTNTVAMIENYTKMTDSSSVVNLNNSVPQQLSNGIGNAEMKSIFHNVTLINQTKTCSMGSSFRPSEEANTDNFDVHTNLTERNEYKMMGHLDGQLAFQHSVIELNNDHKNARPTVPTRVRRSCDCPECMKHQGLPKGHKVEGRVHRCHFENCGKVYGKTSHLMAHLRSHTGERPFVCTWTRCTKSFMRSDELKRHALTHTGVKEFFCNYCCKGFLRKDHLKKHLNTHK